jgi:hypothetical protein
MATSPGKRRQATAKTRPGAGDVGAFLAALEDPAQRADSAQLVAMLAAATGCEPVLWGGGIVGFGQYHYRYDSGHEGVAPRIGFSPRKRELVLYLAPGFEAREALLARLGRHRTGKACLYVKRLADVDRAALQGLVEASVAEMQRRYPA